ncbi:MAG: hypothetical protein IPJ13_01100 [Saprospiraceae bacterium]|nr:hypothetical protein [Saprospiraceae bacterium]
MNFRMKMIGDFGLSPRVSKAKRDDIKEWSNAPWKRFRWCQLANDYWY